MGRGLPEIVFCPRCRRAHKNSCGIIKCFTELSGEFISEEEFNEETIKASKRGELLVGIKGSFCSPKCWNLFLKSWEASNGEE